MTTISTSTSTGITLNATYNPLTIAGTGTIDTGTSNYALWGPSAAYNITNYGLILDSKAQGIGISLAQGGVITNQSTGRIQGVAYAVDIGPGSASIVNYGGVTVTGGTDGFYAPAIYLGAGGQVTNATGAVITGGNYSTGVDAAQSATVINSGTITAGQGISLQAGGSVNNSFIIAAKEQNGIYALGAVTVTNSGRITGNFGFGVDMRAGGSVTNAQGEEIDGGGGALRLAGAFTVSNAGLLTGFGEYAVYLTSTATGVLSNVSHGTITGTDWGVKAGGAVTISNADQIYGQIFGVYAAGGGAVTNLSGGIIQGKSSFGISIKGGAATVTNGGQIVSNATAVSLPSGFTNTLNVLPGASFSGKVNGGNTIGASHVSTIYLMSASSTGTLSPLGTSIINFGSVSFAPGADWLVGGNTAGIAGGEVFVNFNAGDTLQITGVANESIAGYSNGTLSLTGSANLNVLFSTPVATNFQVHNDATLPTATDIVLCFAEGTGILTETGEIPIEELRAGDRVVTLLNGPGAAIAWKGVRRVRPDRHQRPDSVNPIRVRAGAFGEGLPRRDLRLSPDHAIYVDGVLVPVRLLLNGTTIVREPVHEVTYFHLELPEHDLVRANGLACESYLNIGDRSAFDNGGGAVTLHPEFNGPRWEGLACAELVLAGPRLRRIRAGLARGVVRAAA